MNRLVSDACVPMPLQIVIDDVGWWSGRDGSAHGEPFRTGIDRDHAVDDYQAIADLGRQLGMRPQAAMILCEWDRENILRQLPNSTWMGAHWDNSRRVGPWLDQAAAVIRDSADHMEFVLHGVGHEYWEGDTFTRAEWYGPDSRMRPRNQILSHLDAYTRIMRQNDLGDFPTSFVPAAFRYGYGDGDQGLAAILRQWGITFISTPFATARFAAQPQHPLIGIDQGIPTVDRGTEPPIPWNTIAAAPADIPGPILGLHWPNILHPDPAQNRAVVDRWVAFLRTFGRRFTRLLSPDTAAFQTQLAYHLSTRVTLDENELRCDFTRFGDLASAVVQDRFTIKLKTALELEFSSPDAGILSSDRDPRTGDYTLCLRTDLHQPTALLTFRPKASRE